MYAHPCIIYLVFKTVDLPTPKQRVMASSPGSPWRFSEFTCEILFVICHVSVQVNFVRKLQSALMIRVNFPAESQCQRPVASSGPYLN